MEFTEQLKQFSKRILELSNSIANEEATKMSMVVPFFQFLGYDVFNPAEFCPEYTTDVGIKKGEKVDYAILSSGEPEILIECKWCGDNLTKHDSQLFRYFGVSSAKFAILTNGISYKFYTDLEESNKMDLTPFLELNMNNLSDASINALKKFKKDTFDKEDIFSIASELKYSSLIKEWIKEQLDDISDDFAKVILTNVYDGVKTQKIIEKFKPIIKKSFNGYVNDIVTQKISSALDDTAEESEVGNEDTFTASKIVTTDEELQAYNIICAILAECIDLNRVHYRDTESYFGILYDNNNRKPICRLNLDTKKKQIMIPDENKNFSRIYIDSLTDLFTYKKEIINSAKRYVN